MGRGHSGLQGVGRTGETRMRRVEEAPWWDAEGRVGKQGADPDRRGTGQGAGSQLAGLGELCHPICHSCSSCCCPQRVGMAAMGQSWTGHLCWPR